MKPLQLLSFVVILAFAISAQAFDLTKIDRTIRKDPAYQGKPKYCLLVFGPEAKTRIWLVQDGATLYVDRNGNGDLTEAGKKVEAKKTGDTGNGTYEFEVGKVLDRELTHTDLSLSVFRFSDSAKKKPLIREFLAIHRNAVGYDINISMQMPGRTGTGLDGRVHHRVWYCDVQGVLQFADRPQDAPLVHFGGPLQIAVWGNDKTLRIGRNEEVTLGVGTPGVGPGTFAWMAYNNLIPEGLNPRLEITCPPHTPGDAPVKEPYELKHRC